MTCKTLRYGDNFIYLLIEGARAAVVDPGSAAPVLTALRDLGLALDLILITHYHADHTAGCRELKRQTGARIVGPAGGSVPLDEQVGEGGVLRFGETAISVLSVPGHLAHAIAYVIPSEKMLFTGDTLFAGGCGRLFSSDAAAMWRSLCRLRDLPGETAVYGGHDYLLDNLRFAVEIEPDNHNTQRRLDNANSSAPSDVPSTLAEELQTNPFLRCDLPSVKAAAGLPDAAPEVVFAELRRRKDCW